MIPPLGTDIAGIIDAIEEGVAKQALVRSRETWSKQRDQYWCSCTTRLCRV